MTFAERKDAPEHLVKELTARSLPKDRKSFLCLLRMLTWTDSLSVFWKLFLIYSFGAGIEWVVGQVMDKSWTNVLHLSNVCPIFVKHLSMSNFCPINVNIL